ncbi:hypothetical protein CJ030_MR4G029095 [Morella rubra]|uniref:Uncharacterized protein n=1 Tax=Morella rubra TaxID=262757 RepID=A0A6A1VT79_9ROSI|nr:hypothetical protein CJ030_MR4G029095 [Morella rubra]
MNNSNAPKDTSIKVWILLSSNAVHAAACTSVGGDAPSASKTFLFHSPPSTGRGGSAPPLVVAILCHDTPLSAYLLLHGLAGGQGLAVASCHGMSVASWLAYQAWALLGCHAMPRALGRQACARANAMAWLWCSYRTHCRRVKGAHGCHWRLTSASILPHMAITMHVITTDPFKTYGVRVPALVSMQQVQTHYKVLSKRFCPL